MPLPTSIDDLSLTADLNFPAGTDSPSQLDNVQRAHASFIAKLRKSMPLQKATLSYFRSLAESDYEALTLAASSDITELVIDYMADSANTVNLTGSSIKTITALGGCGVRRIGNGSIFVKHGMLVGSAIELTTASSSNIQESLIVVTGVDTSGVLTGDWIYINSSAVSPNVTTGSRTGMLRRIVGKSSNFLTVDLALSQRIDSATSVKGKIYKVAFGEKVTFNGGTYTSDSTTANTSSLLQFLLCRDIELKDAVLTQHGGPGLSLLHCLGGRFNNAETSHLTDDLDNGNNGYGVALGGSTRDFQWESGLAERCRHGITTGTAVLHTQTAQNAWMPWGEPWFSQLSIYGSPESIYMGPVLCRDCTNAAIDSHENGVNITITPNISGGFDGVLIRGWGVNVDGGQIIGTRRSGLTVSNPATSPSPTWVGEIKVKGTLIKGVNLAGSTAGGAIRMVTPGGRLWLEDVTVEECSTAAIAITGAGAVLMGRNVNLINSLPRSGVTAIENAGSNGLIENLRIENFENGISDTGSGNVYQDVETVGVTTLATGNGRITRTERTGDLGNPVSGTFIVSGGRVSGYSVPATDNLMFAVPVIVPAACSVSGVAFQTNIAGATSTVFRTAIYRNIKGFPGAFVSAISSLTGVTGPGVLIATNVGGPIFLTPGIYWVVLVQQGGSPRHSLAMTEDAASGLFGVGIGTAATALSGVAGYTKTSSGGIGSGAFAGPVTEVTSAPKVALVVA